MASTVIVTLTDFTTVPLPTDTGTGGFTFPSPASSPTTSLVSSMTPTPTPTPTTSHLPIPSLSRPYQETIILQPLFPLNSSTSDGPDPLTAHARAREKPNNAFPIILLVAIILIGLVYLAGMALAFFLLHKNRCPNCAGLEKKVRSMEEGTEVAITKKTVRERERWMARGEAGQAEEAGQAGQVGEQAGGHGDRMGAGAGAGVGANHGSVYEDRPGPARRWSQSSPVPSDIKNHHRSRALDALNGTGPLVGGGPGRNPYTFMADAPFRDPKNFRYTFDRPVEDEDLNNQPAPGGAPIPRAPPAARLPRVPSSVYSQSVHPRG